MYIKKRISIEQAKDMINSIVKNKKILQTPEQIISTWISNGFVIDEKSTSVDISISTEIMQYIMEMSINLDISINDYIIHIIKEYILRDNKLR